MPAVRKLASAVIALCLALGCTGAESGEPSFEGELTYDAYSSEPDVAALREGEHGAVVTGVWLVLGDVTFVDNNHCAEPAAAPGHADALGAGDHAPVAAARTRFWLPIGEYCGMRVPLRRGDGDELPDGAPPELAEHSIVLVGELPEHDAAPFAIASTLESTFELEAEDSSFELGPDRARVLVGFDVAAWLDGVELAQEPDDDGRVVVSEDSHPDLLERFEQNLADGVGAFLDPRGTGRVEVAGDRLAHVR